MALDLPKLVQKYILDASGVEAGAARASSSVKAASAEMGAAAEGGSVKTIGAWERASAKMMSVGSTMTKTVTLPILGIAAVSYKAGEELEQATDKVEAAYGRNAEKVIDWSKTTAKSFGIAQDAALGAAGTFGQMFHAMGIGADTSIKMTEKLIGLSSDIALFSNKDPEAVLNALQKGLTGATRGLKSFGIVADAGRIQAEAYAEGLAKPTQNAAKIAAAHASVEQAVKNLGEAQAKHGKQSLEATKAQAALEVAQDRLNKSLEGQKVVLTAGQKAQAIYGIVTRDTANLQGYFAEHSDRAAAKNRILHAEIHDAFAEIGTRLLPIGAKFVAMLAGIAAHFTALSPRVQNIILIVGGLAAVMGPLLIIFSKLMQAGQQVGGMLARAFGSAATSAETAAASQETTAASAEAATTAMASEADTATMLAEALSIVEGAAAAAAAGLDALTVSVEGLAAGSAGVDVDLGALAEVQMLLEASGSAAATGQTELAASLAESAAAAATSSAEFDAALAGMGGAETILGAESAAASAEIDTLVLSMQTAAATSTAGALEMEASATVAGIAMEGQAGAAAVSATATEVAGVAATEAAGGFSLLELATGPVLIAIAALALGVYEAYQHFGPFHAAIDAIWQKLQAFGQFLYRDAIAPIKAFWYTLTSGFTQDEGTGIENFALKVRGVLLPLFNWVKEAVGGVKQIIGVLFQGDFKGGGPFAEDSPFISTLFHFRDTAIEIVRFVEAHWKQFAIGAAAAFAPAVLAVGVVIAVLWKFRSQVATVIEFVARVIRVFAVGAFTVLRPFVEAIAWVVRELWGMRGAVYAVVNFILDHWKLFALGAALAFAPITTTVALIIALFMRFRDQIVGAVTFVGSMFAAIWNGVLKPVFDALLAVVGFVILTVTEIFSTWVGRMGGFFHEVGAVASWLWESVLQPVFGFIVSFLKAYVETEFNILQTVVTVVFNAVAAVAGWLWNTILSPIFGFIRSAIETVVVPAFERAQSVAETIFHAIGAVGSWLWDNALHPAFSAIAEFINNTILPVWTAMHHGFDVAINGIAGLASSVWPKITGAFKSGLRVLGDVVGGILHAASSVASVVGAGSVASALMSASKNAFGWGEGKESGGTIPVSSGGGTKAYARGGMMKGREVGSGFVTNGPTAITGAPSRRPQYVIPTDPKYRKRALALTNAMLANVGLTGGWQASTGHAAGGKVPYIQRGSMYYTRGARAVVGEGAPGYPEYVFSTETAHRSTTMRMIGALLGNLGADVVPTPAHGIGGIASGIGHTITHVGSDIIGAGEAAARSAAVASLSHLWPTFPTSGPLGTAIAGGAINKIRGSVLTFLKGKESGGTLQDSAKAWFDADWQQHGHPLGDDFYNLRLSQFLSGVGDRFDAAQAWFTANPVYGEGEDYANSFRDFISGVAGTYDHIDEAYGNFTLGDSMREMFHAPTAPAAAAPAMQDAYNALQTAVAQAGPIAPPSAPRPTEAPALRPDDYFGAMAARRNAMAGSINAGVAQRMLAMQQKVASLTERGESIVVNVETNADPLQIAREIMWEKHIRQR